MWIDVLDQGCHLCPVRICHHPPWQPAFLCAGSVIYKRTTFLDVRRQRSPDLISPIIDDCYSDWAIPVSMNEGSGSLINFWTVQSIKITLAISETVEDLETTQWSARDSKDDALDNLTQEW